MKILLMLLLAVTTVNLSAQETTDTYCMILGTKMALKNKVKVQIDFGEGISQWKPRESMLKDEKGIALKFDSMIDALNYMSKKGWYFVNAYSVSTGNSNVLHWIMVKEVPLSEVN
jgi:hypothetical protein